MPDPVRKYSLSLDILPFVGCHRVAVRRYSEGCLEHVGTLPGGEMDYRNRIVSGVVVRAVSWAAMTALLFSLSAGQATRAQSPNAAASGPAKSDQGFYPGWTLGARFEGSTSGDGSVYDLGFGAVTTSRIILESAWAFPSTLSAHPPRCNPKTRKRFLVRVWETWGRI